MSRADDWEKYSESDRWRAVARDVDGIEQRQAAIERTLGRIQGLLVTAVLGILSSLILLIIGRL